MKVAVVILTYNNLEYIKDFLPTVLSNTRDAQIWIVDNDSSDGTLSYVDTYFKSVKTISLGKNYGFAGGYNEGLKQIEADYYILLNSDVEVTPDWTQPLISSLQAKDVIAVQPKMKFYHQRSHFEYAGASGGWIDSLGYPFCRGRIFDSLEEDTGQYEDIQEVFWATGACMAVDAKLFLGLGGFDDSYFAHMEEIDWCWRVKRAGYKVLVNPQSVVYHVGGGTLNKTNPFKTTLNFRNSLSTIQKNHSNPKRTIFNRLLLDGVAAIHFLLKGDFKNIIAILKAHLEFYAMYRKNSLMKKEFDALIEVYRIGESNMTGLYKTSILSTYYISKKKKFSEL